MFNPGEAVEGYSNIAWVLGLAAGVAMGLSPAFGALVGAGLAMVALLTLSVMVSRSLRPSTPLPTRWTGEDLWPAWWLALTPECMVWSSGGLETAAAATAGLASMLAWQRGRWTLAGLAAALAWLLRHDAILPVVGFVAASLIVSSTPPPRRSRAMVWGLVAFVGPVALHLGWRWMTYGAWLPHTWSVKSAGIGLRGSWGSAYLRSWATAVHLLQLTPLALFLRRRHIPLAVAAGTTLIYGWWVGGDFMAYSRLLLPATALVGVLVGDTLIAARRWLSTRWGLRGDIAGMGLVIVAFGLLGYESMLRWRSDRQHPTEWIDGRWEGVTAMDRFAQVGLAAGSWMHEHLPASTVITVGAAGAVPYASKLVAIDAYGLTDPNVVTWPGSGPFHSPRHRPGHQYWAPPAYIRTRAPDLLCHVGYRGPTMAPSPSKPRAYRAGYAWMCIELGLLTDHRGETFDGGRYCCLRPSGESGPS